MLPTETPDLARAVALIELKRYAEARTYLDKHLSAHPKDGQAFAFISYCFLHEGRFAEAVGAAREAVTCEPEEPAAHYGLALALYHEAHTHELWSSSFREVLAHARGLKRSQEAILEAMRLDPSQPDYYALLAQLYQEEWHPRKAVNALLQGLTLDPTHAACCALLSQHATCAGSHSAAETLARQMIARAPENPHAHCLLGWALLHRGDHRGAEPYFREALRLDATNKRAHDGLGRAVKARWWFYRPFHRAFLWVGRRSAWGLIGLLWLGVAFLLVPPLLSCYAPSKSWEAWLILGPIGILFGGGAVLGGIDWLATRLARPFIEGPVEPGSHAKTLK